ncbi:MAG: hypothetical protein WC602_02230 [archaeon]
MKKWVLLLLLVIFSCDSPTGLNDDEFVIEFKHYYCGTERYSSGVRCHVNFWDSAGYFKGVIPITTNGKPLIIKIDNYQYLTYKLTVEGNLLKEGTVIFGEKDKVVGCI